ncbi:hypothetical protein ES703_18378 [subsurface metagenome]
MAISPKCKPIASSGLMAYLAIDDALEAIREEDYKEAYSACGNAIGHFNTMFINKNITPEELVNVTAPLIAAKGAYDFNNKDRMFEEVLGAMETTKEFIFQKVVACECEGR